LPFASRLFAVDAYPSMQLSDTSNSDRNHCSDEPSSLDAPCVPGRRGTKTNRVMNTCAKEEVESGLEFCRWVQGKVAGDAEAKQTVVNAFAGHVVTMAFHPWGCRAIQYVLDVGDDESCARLVEEMRGHVVAACLSPHANFVLSKAVEILPPSRCDWIFEELEGSALQVARDSRGCRVLCRLFAREDIWQDERGAIEGLISFVLGRAAELSYHPFGEHVLEAIFTHGAERHRSMALAAFRGKAARMSKNRHASYMVQRALQVCQVAERVEIANEILGASEILIPLCQHQFGNHVVRTALGVSGGQADVATRLIMDAQSELQKSTYGRKFLRAFVQF